LPYSSVPLWPLAFVAHGGRGAVTYGIGGVLPYASAIAPISASFASNRDQSSASAIRAQIASTSSISIAQGDVRLKYGWSSRAPSAGA
jgi:hypothetical protein